MTPGQFKPLACIVDFHHLRGPEIEKWFGLDENLKHIAETDWALLPFFALPDGSHAFEEEFSYFTLRCQTSADAGTSDSENTDTATSLFGIACTRHIRAEELIFRPSEVTRTSVQKAVVIIVDTPYLFSRIKEKLSAVTATWFAQKDFRDIQIIEQFHDHLVTTHEQENTDEYFGLSLRELIHEYKYQTMVLFKCLLLQPKMLFFGANCERLCMLQFALVSLIPGLLRNLQDCADASMNSYEHSLNVSSSLRTSDRNSLLSYMGLPLQLFGKGAFFGPYIPLQQLDMLSDFATDSFVAGSTNSLLVQQNSRYCDTFVNLDEHSIEILKPSLRLALTLSVPDRRFIDFLTQTVTDTWDPEYPARPANHGYTGSEDFIRLQFEEYLLALLSCVKYRQFVEKHGSDPKALLSDAQGDPTNDFGTAWVEAWLQTDNYRLFSRFTDSHLFDVVEPRHPTTGALSVEDVQRRVAQQVAELHLDERFNSGKEVLGKTLATGQKKVSTAINTLWADIEVMRDAQRRKSAVSSEKGDPIDDGSAAPPTGRCKHALSNCRMIPTRSQRSSTDPSIVPKAPDLSQAQANVQAASARAGAYLSSWGTWAAEKRKVGFRGSSPVPEAKPTVVSSTERNKETAKRYSQIG